MSKTKKAEWQFAPTGGGVLYGYNNASAEHFKQDPVGKLVRETVQNSLDAHEDGLPPVEIDIYECDIDAEHVGAASLAPHIAQSVNQMKSTGQAEGRKNYQAAMRLVKQATIPCLAIVDRNTTGLQDRKWESLIHEEGTTEKDQRGAPGGSFGIGKNAPYNVSALHTVIYCTRFTKNRQGRVERMTGRTQLVSHPSPANGAMLQHIGFYAHDDHQPITVPNIPEPFRLEEPGTGLWILGFNTESRNWHTAAVKAVADSFFYAVHHRKLTVNITPRNAAKPIKICHDTIDGIIEQRSSSPRTAHYYRAIRRDPIGSTEPAGPIGALDLYINNEKGAPRRVAYVNRQGMLITDTKERRRSNPFHPGSGQGAWPDYAAVVVAREDGTDRQIRRMENPAHDLISAERLPESEQESAREHLNCVSTQIRDIIEASIREQDRADISNLTELAEMFRDLDPNLPGNRELATHTVTPSPQQHRVTTLDDDSDKSGDADQDGDGDNGNGGSRGDRQRGDGDGNGRKGGSDYEGPEGKGSAKGFRQSIQQMIIMRTGKDELSVAMSPTRNAGRKISFTIEPSGELARRESRVAITDVVSVEPADAKVGNADGIITVNLPKGHHGPIIMTLNADQNVAYTGYGFSERQAPADVMTSEERIAKIQEMLDAGLTQAKIGRELEISPGRVSQLVKKHNLKKERKQ